MDKTSLKKNIINIVLFVLVVFIFLFVAESVCRMFIEKEESSIVKYEYTIDKKTVDDNKRFLDQIDECFLINNGVLLYHTCFLGEDTEKYDQNKNNDAQMFRIIFLGDSITAGSGVPKEKRFTDLLQQKLGPSYEIFNFAMPGYNLEQIAILAEETLQYKPNLIVYVYFVNDVNLQGFVTEEGDLIKLTAYSETVPFVIALPFNTFLLEHSIFYRWINKKAFIILQKISTKYEPEYYYLSEERAKKALKKMIYLTEKNNLTMHIILFPNLIDDNYGMDNFVKKNCCSKNVKVFDLREKLRNRYKVEELRISPFDVHLNEKGHKTIAEILYDYLQNEEETIKIRNRQD